MAVATAAATSNGGDPLSISILPRQIYTYAAYVYICLGSIDIDNGLGKKILEPR